MGFVAIFLIGEIVLRIFFSDALQVIQFRPPMYALDSVTHYRYVPGDYPISRHDTIHVNREGFIGREIGPACDSVFRIAIVGASETSGTVDFNVYTSFPPELESVFRKNHWNVEVINCGLDGSRSYDSYRMVENRVTRLHPDLILLNYNLPLQTINGVREVYRNCVLVYLKDDTLCRKLAMERVDTYYDKMKYIKILYALNHSYVMRVPLKLLLKYYRDWLPRKNPSNRNITIQSWIYLLTERNVLWQRPYEQVFGPDESIRMIKELQNRLQTQGISFFLFAENCPDEDITTARNNKLPLIRLNQEYEADDYLHADGHKNKKGNRKLAKKLYEVLVRHRIVPEEYKKE